jgi:hypothetical protein
LGLSEDQLFELVVCAAVGQSTRLYEAGDWRPWPKRPADVREVLAAGVSPEQVEDALAVCAAFNTTDRLADAFGFEVLSPEAFAAGAKYLLKRGYR